MKLLARWRSVWRTLRDRAGFEAGMEEEFRFHIERRAEDLEASGIAPEDALRRARQEFGSREHYKEEGRRARGLRWADEFAGDARYAIRSLRRNPGFTAAAVLTLALGIGANTAIFSVVDGVLFRSLPYPESERLVSLWPDGMFPRGAIDLLHAEARSYERIGAYHNPTHFSLTGEGQPERLVGAEVTPELFGTLGASAQRGRVFEPGEEEPGRGSVMVLSHGLWQRRFGGDPEILGRTLRIDGEARRVVGIMPPDFAFPSAEVELWVPATFQRAIPAVHWGSYWMHVVARVRDGTSIEQANAELDASLLPRIHEGFPFHMPDEWGAEASVVPLRDAVTAGFERLLLVLLGAVGLVLLIACVNVANLLIARSGSRGRELAVRAALGAGRGRLGRQLLTESLVLGLAGGVLGVALAFAAAPALAAALPPDLPRLDEIALDGRVLGFAFLVAVGTGLLFGSAPALRMSRPRLHDALKEGRGAGEPRHRRRAASALVIAEIALAVMLVTGAGLLIRSLSNVLRLDPGFRADGIITAVVAPPAFRYGQPDARLAFYDALVDRMTGFPSTAAAAVATGAPFSGGIFFSVFLIDGAPAPGTAGAEWPGADHYVAVGPGYFDALGVRLERGRPFTPADRAGSLPVAIIGRTLADRYWPGEDPIGKRIGFPGREGWWTIVGITPDVKYGQLTEVTGGSLFLPLAQSDAAGPMRLILRTDHDPQTAAADIRRVVAELDRDTPLSDLRTMDDAISSSVAGSRSVMLLLSLFAALALSLGAVGIYGVTAYSVTRRAPEIGIRIALGARRADVLRLLLRSGAALSLAGLALGFLAAIAASGALSSLLFGVRPADPAVLAAVATLVSAVALLATWIPARRAARLDPIRAVRSD